MEYITTKPSYQDPGQDRPRVDLQWGELSPREVLVLVQKLQQVVRKQKYADLNEYVLIEESRQLGLNILTARPNLDESFLFIDYDYDRKVQHIDGNKYTFKEYIQQKADAGELQKLEKLAIKLEKDIREHMLVTNIPDPAQQKKDAEAKEKADKEAAAKEAANKEAGTKADTQKEPEPTT